MANLYFFLMITVLLATPACSLRKKTGLSNKKQKQMLAFDENDQEATHIKNNKKELDIPSGSARTVFYGEEFE